MNIYELRRNINSFFDGEAQVYITSPNRIEVDVSTNISKEKWLECADKLNLEDNSKSILNSWKHNGITVLFSFGALQSFTKKKKTPNVGF